MPRKSKEQKTEKKIVTKPPIWHFVDVNGEILGRVSTKIAKLLIGKGKPDYTPNIQMGDKVVVTNAANIKVTGKKLKQKIYYRYTGYHGSVKAEKLEDLLKRDPRKVIERAVRGMLPRNKLMKRRMANLYIFPGMEHPHKAHEKKVEPKDIKTTKGALENKEK